MNPPPANSFPLLEKLSLREVEYSRQDFVRFLQTAPLLRRLEVWSHHWPKGEENTGEEAILTALEVLRVKTSYMPLTCLEYPNLQKLDLQYITHLPWREHWWQPFLHNAPYSRLEQVTLRVPYVGKSIPLHLSDLVTQHPSIHSLTLAGNSMHETVTDSDVVNLCEALRTSRERGRPLGLRQLTLSESINLSSGLTSNLAELGVGLSYRSPE